jgi:hypothetical protein
MVALGPPDGVPAISLFFDAMARTLPDVAPPRNSPLFCLQDLDALQREMQDAGFHHVEVAPFASRLEVRSGTDRSCARPPD